MVVVKIRRFLGYFFLLLGGLSGCYFLYRDNIHEVIPAYYYRSAQLAPNVLSNLIDKRNIQTVINLRGAHPEAPWYQKEIKVVEEKHIAYHNLPLRAYHFPEVSQIRTLIRLIEDSPKPILIHCESGADRTGLASALVVFWNTGGDLTRSWKQISWHYGAVYPNSVGKLVLKRYQLWLDQRKERSSIVSFKTWISQLA